MKNKINTITPFILFGLFSTLIIHAAFQTPLFFDQAFFATVVKNTAHGLGFVMSYHEITPIFAMSTGPTVLFPAAALMFFTGNTIWAPAVIASIINLSWLAIFLFTVHKKAQNINFFSFSAILLILFVFYEAQWWSTLIGEISSILLLFIASIVCIYEKNIPKKYILLGILAGLSFQAKAISLPGFGAIAFYLAIALLTEKIEFNLRVKKLIYAAVIGLSVFLLTLLPFKAFEIANSYQHGKSISQLIEYKTNFYQTNDSVGLAKLIKNPKKIKSNLTWSTNTLKNTLSSYHINPYIIYLLIIIALITAFLSKKESALTRLMGTICIFYLVWYYFLLSAAFERHLLHLTLAFIFLYSLLLSNLPKGTGIIIVIIMLALVPSSLKKTQFIQTLTLQDKILYIGQPEKKYNAAIIKATDYIAKTTFTYPLANCGWFGATRDIEYLLPKHNNFNDCLVLIDKALIKNNNTYQWKHPVNFTWVINNLNYSFSNNKSFIRKRNTLLMQACSQNTLYSSELFRIMECRFDDLKKVIPLTKSSPFINPKWDLAPDS